MSPGAELLLLHHAGDESGPADAVSGAFRFQVTGFAEGSPDDSSGLSWRIGAGWAAQGPFAGGGSDPPSGRSEWVGGPVLLGQLGHVFENRVELGLRVTSAYLYSEDLFDPTSQYLSLEPAVVGGLAF